MIIGQPALVPEWHARAEHVLSAEERAARALIHPGATLTHFDGESVRAIADVQRLISGLAARAAAQGLQKIPVVLKLSPSTPIPAAAGPSAFDLTSPERGETAAASSSDEGIDIVKLALRVRGSVTGLGINVAEDLDADGNIVVVVGAPPLVSDWAAQAEGMTPEENAQRARLKTRDVIRSINEQHQHCQRDSTSPLRYLRSCRGSRSREGARLSSYFGWLASSYGCSLVVPLLAGRSYPWL